MQWSQPKPKVDGAVMPKVVEVGSKRKNKSLLAQTETKWLKSKGERKKFLKLAICCKMNLDWW